MRNQNWLLALVLIPVVGCAQDSNSVSIKEKALKVKEGSFTSELTTQSDNGNYYDVRSFGVKPDKKTDWTNRIGQIVKDIGPHSTLYIPSGVDWDYRGIYKKMLDYQTIIDDSGRDKPRRVWQNSRYIWYKTNSETQKTSGNTFGVAGNYHPAFFIDTWSDDINGRRSSLIFRDHGDAKWQLVSNPGSEIRDFSIVQYGSKVYGTRSLVIGHQDGPAWGKYAFNAPINKNTTTSYSFGKPQSVKENENFSVMYSRPQSDSGSFTDVYKHGNSVTFRTDIYKDGTKIDMLKGGGRITTDAKGAVTGNLLNIISAKSNLILTKDKSGSYISNIDASNAVSITLPKAEPGINYEISVDSKHPLSIKPNGTDSFVGSASGQALLSNKIQSKVKLIAVSNTTWSVEKYGSWNR